MTELPEVERPVRIEVSRISFALRHAHVAAHGAEQQREVAVVRVVMADGATGWGECPALSSPGYTAEHLDGAWAVLVGRLGPAVLAGADGTDPAWPMASASLADAALDARLRRRGESLALALAVLTGRAAAEVATAVESVAVVGIHGSIEDLLARVEAERGGVKLKVRPGWDLEPLRAVRGVWPDRWLAADANGSLGRDDLDRLVRAKGLDDLGLAYLEQPATGLTGCAEFATRLATPVALDESVGGLAAAQRAHRAGALRVLNVKPARVGGVEAAARLAAWAVGEGVPAFVGGMLESGIGRAGALAVAAQPTCSLPTDLGPSERYVERDVAGPLGLDQHGQVVVPTGPGLGVVPDVDLLDAATVDRVVLER